VALILDWDGLSNCCDVYWLFHGRRRLHKERWILYLESDLLHTRMHFLWFWEFWIGISAWRLCWTCWRKFCSLAPYRFDNRFVDVQLFSILRCEFFLSTSISLLLSIYFLFLLCVLSNLTCNRSVVLGILLLLFEVWWFRWCWLRDSGRSGE
jgi:hypothetical protein